MKKFLVSFLLIVACVVTAACFAGCNDKSELELTYGEKYGEDDDCYIFNADGTGTHEYYNKNTDLYGEETSVSSYTISFLWQIQSDNCIHLVFDSVTYNSDHTASKTVDSINSYPIAYSKDMLTYSSVSGGQYSTYTRNVQFIRQGSRLDVTN